jgi:predicted DNA-binding ribbon-helix-helix protein
LDRLAGNCPASEQKLTEIMGEIDRERQNSNLSSATRVYVLRFFRTRV